MKKNIVDANAFLRYLIKDIPEQERKFEKLLQKAKKSEVILLLPQIIIFEIQFILDKYYHVDKNEIIDKLKLLVSSSYLQIVEREVFQSALVIYTSENISFVDSFLLAKTIEEKAELFTFDQKLQKLQE